MALTTLRRESIVPAPPSDAEWSIQTDMPNSIWVTSSKFYPSSRFMYPALLEAHNILPHQWDEFTSRIRDLARWDGSGAAHVKTNIGLFVLGAFVVGAAPIFAILGVSYYRRERAELEHSNIMSRSIMLEGGHLANITKVVQHYNDTLFSPVGLQVKISIPLSAQQLRRNGAGNRVTILVGPAPNHVHQENTPATPTAHITPMSPSQVLAADRPESAGKGLQSPPTYDHDQRLSGR